MLPNTKKEQNKYYSLITRRARLKLTASPITETIGAIIGVLLLWIGGLDVLLFIIVLQPTLISADDHEDLISGVINAISIDDNGNVEGILLMMNNGDFMNIDIEGHEIEVLKSINFRKTKVNVICVEVLDYDKRKKKQLLNFFKKNTCCANFTSS